MRRLFVLAMVLGTLAALPAAAASAEPAWTRLDIPITQLPTGFDLVGLPGRQALVYWTDTEMRVTERAPGGAFSTPQKISETYQSQMAFAPNGDGVIVANTQSGTLTGFRPAGGPPSALTAFGGSAHASMAVGVDANGKALAAIRTTDGKLRVSERAAGAAATFSTPVQTQNDESVTLVQSVFPPYLEPVLDADGAAAIVFSSTNQQLRVVTRTAGGAFGASAAMPGTPDAMPAFARNRAGDAVLVWSEGVFIKASYRSRGGTFGPGEVIHSANEGMVETKPVAAVDGAGRVVAAWSTAKQGTFECDPRDRYRMRTAFRATNGTWTVKPDRPGQLPVVAASDTADAAAARFLLVYRRIDPRLNECTAGLATRRIVGEVGAFDAVAAPLVLPGQTAEDDGASNYTHIAAMTPAGDGITLFESDQNDVEVAAFEGGGTATPPIDDADETPPAKDDKTVVPGDGGTNNAPLGFQGTGPSGARGPDVGARQAGGTLAVDPRIFSPVPPPVPVAQLAGGIPLTLGCASACALTVSGQVQLGSGGAARAAKVSRIRLKGMTVRLKAGERRKVRVKLPKRAITQIKRAVRRRQRAVAVLTISAPGAKPKTITVRFRR
jgi:hypothetical protein